MEESINKWQKWLFFKPLTKRFSRFRQKKLTVENKNETNGFLQKRQLSFFFSAKTPFKKVEIVK